MSEKKSTLEVVNEKQLKLNCSCGISHTLTMEENDEKVSFKLESVEPKKKRIISEIVP